MVFGAAAEAQRRLGDVLAKRHTAAESGALGKVGGAALGKGKLPAQGRGKGSAKVDLEKVRVLSSSKVAEVSARSQTKGASHKRCRLERQGPSQIESGVCRKGYRSHQSSKMFVPGNMPEPQQYHFQKV